MLSRALTAVAVAAALTVTGCASDDDPPPDQPRTSSTTTPAPAADIGSVADEMAALLNQGCGEDPKPSCTQANLDLHGHARELRQLMVDSGETEYYREGKVLADRVLTATSTEPLRTAVIDLLDWLEQNPA